jgi:hypothetical protein
MAAEYQDYQKNMHDNPPPYRPQSRSATSSLHILTRACRTPSGIAHVQGHQEVADLLRIMDEALPPIPGSAHARSNSQDHQCGGSARSKAPLTPGRGGVEGFRGRGCAGAAKLGGVVGRRLEHDVAQSSDAGGSAAGSPVPSAGGVKRR